MTTRPTSTMRPAGALGVLVLLSTGIFMAVSGGGVGAPRLLTLLLIAPAAEEIAFRAGFQEALLRRHVGPAISNILVALAFAAAHVLVRGESAALLVSVPALAIGALYGRRRRLAECIALHAAMNAVWLCWTLAR